MRYGLDLATTGVDSPSLFADDCMNCFAELLQSIWLGDHPFEAVRGVVGHDRIVAVAA